MSALSIRLCALVSASFLATSVASASPALSNGPAGTAPYLTNGDFELVDNRIGIQRGQRLDRLNRGRWDVYSSLPGGWYTSQGAGIEVQHSGTVVQAHSGNHYLELDSHGRSSNSSASIDVALRAGTYELSVAYQARTNRENDNGIRVLFGDREVLTLDGTRSRDRHWDVFTTQIFATESDLHTLTFQAFGIENSLGGFIDDVSISGVSPVTTVNPVPEPSAALIFGLGLVTAGRAIRKQR